MADPFIIMCAPNGARHTKADHPALPLTPEEIGQCAAEILTAGASMIHLHVREPDARHSLNVEHYREAIAAIKDRVGNKLVIQVTSEAAGRYGPEAQREMVRTLRPEAVSVALREICPQKDHRTEAIDFFQWMGAAGIFYQIILYNDQDVALFEVLQKESAFVRAPFLLFVVGQYGIAPPQELCIAKGFERIICGHKYPWMMCAFGATEGNILAITTVKKGHIRVGFENNLLRSDGTKLENNAELVQQAANHALGLGLKIASASDVRRIFLLH